MPEIRWIDTAGLPAKFDIADLVDSGVVGEALLAWCRERVRQGPPPVVEVPAQRPKPQGDQRNTPSMIRHRLRHAAAIVCDGVESAH